MRIALIVLGVLAVLVLLALAGFVVRPSGYPLAETSRDLGRATLATGLPAPVARFAKEIEAEGLPRVDSAVIVGSGTIRLGPLKAPLRFRGEYRPPRAYSRVIEVTWFGIPIMNGLDTWKDGRGSMTAFGKTSAGPDMDQGANMAAYAEALWMPSALLTDSRAKWEAVDDTHARLVFPFEDGTDSITYEFDPATGRPKIGRAMRFKAGEDHKTEWIVRMLEWGRVDGRLTPVRSDVRWGDAKEPWATFDIAGIVLNAPVPQLENR